MRGARVDPRARRPHATDPRLGRSATPAPEIDIRIGGRASTQQAFGDALVALSRDAAFGPHIVTASPDVAVSTSLGGWINRVGVFAQDAAAVVDDTPRPLTWAPKPAGQHIELGISEMNLFMWLSQFGLSAELFGEPLIPVGTVYDPFICRGLDALVYGAVHPVALPARRDAIGRHPGARRRGPPVGDHAVDRDRAARACTPTSRPSPRRPRGWSARRSGGSSTPRPTSAPTCACRRAPSTSPSPTRSAHGSVPTSGGAR